MYFKVHISELNYLWSQGIKEVPSLLEMHINAFSKMFKSIVSLLIFVIHIGQKGMSTPLILVELSFYHDQLQPSL